MPRCRYIIRYVCSAFQNAFRVPRHRECKFKCYRAHSNTEDADLKKKKDAVSRGKLDSFLKEYIPNYMLEKEPSEREKKGRRGGTCRGGAI